MVDRIDIERALEKLANDEAGFRFQRLAVVLAKLRWRDLIASELHKDRGLDAYVSKADSSDERGKGLACSLTGTLGKIKSDAKKIQKHYPDVSLLIFYTAEAVTQETKAKWSAEIREKFDYELVVASREEIVTSLQIPGNAQLCRTHLEIPVPSSAGVNDLLAKAREAASSVCADWRAHPGISGKPYIALNTVSVAKAGGDTTEIVSTSSLLSLLQYGRRLVLEGSAGRGKTTTLIHLAEASQSAGGIPLLIDLPNWVRSGKDILDYIASSPSFRARGIDAHALAQLSNAAPLLFLLNGWNEIAEFYSAAGVDALRNLERAFPSAGIVVATRTHHIVPPLPGASRFRILPITPQQRFDYLAQALGHNSAQEFHSRLACDGVLDDLTRTPFVLAAFTALVRAKRPIPRTKLGLLYAIIRLAEESDQHAGPLQSAPLRGLAGHYLRALALEMTRRGDTAIAEPDARAICSRVSEALRAVGQISAVPESADILNVLASRHVLDRNEYPTASFRFEHQQFQEYFVALTLKEELTQIVASGDRTKRDLFSRVYVNDPNWSEPLQMIASDLGTEGQIEVHKALVDIALQLDAIFAARLAFGGGPRLWPEIRTATHDRLRTLYAASNQQLRDYALSAMLATGSDEFQDIILPLLTSADQQVRLGAYRLGMPFHPTSLGANWRAVIDGWNEELRAEFVSELTTYQGNGDVGLIFAQSDPSLKVRVAALHGLIWLRLTDAVVGILESLPDTEFGQAVSQFHPEEIPFSLRPRAIMSYRSRLNGITDPKVRLQIAHTLAELGDPDTPARLKAELTAFPSDLLKGISDHALRPILEILHSADPQWLSAWLTDRAIVDGLWRDDWRSLISEVTETRKAELIQRVASQDMKRGGGLAILRVFADPETARAIFIAYRDYQPIVLGDPQNPEKQAINQQLRGLLRSLPRGLVVDGLADLLSHPPTIEDLPILVDLCGLRGADGDGTNPFLNDAQRDRLRDYLKSAVPFVLTQADFNGQAKGYLSYALSRVGSSDDIADIMELIRADIVRVRAGRALQAAGQRNVQARGASSSWSSWHIETLIRIGGRECEPLLLSLLEEPAYEIEVAWGLCLIARRTLEDPNVLGARAGHRSRDFRQIRSSATAWRDVFVENMRQRYAVAIRRRVLSLMGDMNMANPDAVVHSTHRLRELAKPLAELDSQDSADIVLQIAELHDRLDGWTRVALLESLTFAGVPLPEARTKSIVESVLTRLRAHGVHSNDGHLLARLLCLLPFVDRPKEGVAHIRELLAEFRVSWYDNRDLLFALAQCPDEAGLDLLCEIAGTNPSLFENGAKDWVDAVASSPTTGAREIILGCVDPNARVCIAGRKIPEYALGALAAHLGRIGQAVPSIGARLLALTARPLPPQPRAVLAKTLAWSDIDGGLMAAIQLIDDSATPCVPYEVFRALEDLFLEKRAHGASSQSYTLVPRAANELKRRLYDMAKNDARRTQSAYSLLAQIEEWRLEYGRPPSEPRHPFPESGEMWPSIAPASAQ